MTAHLKSVNRANQKNSFYFINLYKQAKQNSEKTDKPAPPLQLLPSPKKFRAQTGFNKKLEGFTWSFLILPIQLQ